MLPADYLYASIRDLARGLRARKFCSVELTEVALEALGRVGPRFNAVANLTPERARREAALADRRLARGDPSPLLGIPYGAKDLLAARGAPTTWGAPHFKDQVFEEDARVVDRLRRRGAVLAAKLAMVELAGAARPSHPGSSLHGQGRNPWNPEHYSGGSSSGSAIAVATGLLPYALGSETGGSILGPAAYCGVTGVRPTVGLVSRQGALVVSWTLDKIGVLARSAADCALVLEAIAGRFRALDARSARAGVRRARVGLAGDDVETCTETARPAIAAGIEEFRRIAPNTREAALRPDLPYAATIDLIMLAEAATVFGAYLGGPRFELADPDQGAKLRDALRIPAREYLDAMRVRAEVVDEFQRLFRHADVLLSASRPETAPRLDAPRLPRADRRTPDRLRAAANLAGLPGVFFPCGVARDGLPVGLQLVGPPRSEPLLLALAEAYQRETAHHLARPPFA